MKAEREGSTAIFGGAPCTSIPQRTPRKSSKLYPFPCTERSQSCDSRWGHDRYPRRRQRPQTHLRSPIHSETPRFRWHIYAVLEILGTTPSRWLQVVDISLRGAGQKANSPTPKPTTSPLGAHSHKMADQRMCISSTSNTKADCQTIDWRMQLNNLLQITLGTNTLTWEEYQDGPQHIADWVCVAKGMATLLP